VPDAPPPTPKTQPKKKKNPRMFWWFHWSEEKGRGRSAKHQQLAALAMAKAMWKRPSRRLPA